MMLRHLKLLVLIAPFALGAGLAIAQDTSTSNKKDSDLFASPTGIGESPMTVGASPIDVGGYRPIAQPAPGGGIRAGAFTISPAVSAAVGHDDNVALRNTNKISSPFYSLAPSVTVALPGPGQRYAARYFGNYGRYSSSSKDDYEDHGLGLNANNEWSTRLRTLFGYDYFRGHDPRGATATATVADAPDRWYTNDIRGVVGYGARGAKGNIEVNAGWGNRRYQTNTAITGAKDYDHTDLGATFYYRVAPATQALFQARGSRIDYDTNTSLDSTESRYYVGLRWEATAKTQGTAKIGYIKKDFSDSTRPNFSRPSYEAGVRWAPKTYSVFNLDAMRTFNEQTSGGDFILTDNVSLLWNHDWSSRVRSTALIAHGRDVHEGINRTDTRDNLGLKATYAFRRWLRLGGEVRREKRDSNVPTDEYTRNLMLFTLDATL